MTGDSTAVAPVEADILPFLSRRYGPRNKVPGVVAEIEFAKYVDTLGFGKRLVRGGWIVEPNAPDFYSRRIALFPAPFGGSVAPPTPVLTAAQFLRVAGIQSLYCLPVAASGLDYQWEASNISGPEPARRIPILEAFGGFPSRRKRLSSPKNRTDVSPLMGAPHEELEALFARESMLDAVRARYLTVANDLDFLIWGDKATYPVEIKEKTVATDDYMGEYFGIDIGPFAKLATFSSYGSSLRALFIVREIEDVQSRRLKDWHVVRSDDLCRSCSWVWRAGGMNMKGGGSATVRVPLAAFQKLAASSLGAL